MLAIAVLMDVTVLDLLGACRANRRHRAGKHERHARQRMVSIENHLVVRDFGDAVNQDIVVITAFRRRLI